MVGVNGVGKTTTTAKIAGLLQARGYSVLLAAADTYRAAAGPFAILSVAVLVACLGGFRAGYVPVSSAPLMVGILISSYNFV